MRNNQLGTYIGREIRATTTTELDTLRQDRLESSLVLFWLNGIRDRKELEAIIKNLIGKNPLGITVAGLNAEKCFDVLLEMQSVTETKHHIMTGISSEANFSDAAEEFFLVAIPEEKMFDCWRQYWIIADEDISYDDIAKIDLDIELTT